MNITIEQYLALSALTYKTLPTQTVNRLGEIKLDKIGVNFSALELKPLSSLAS